MKRSDLDTDTVLAAVRDGKGYNALCERFPEKLVIAAYVRETYKGNLQCGVSLRTSWLTEQGRERISTMSKATGGTIPPLDRNNPDLVPAILSPAASELIGSFLDLTIEINGDLRA